MRYRCLSPVSHGHGSTPAKTYKIGEVVNLNADDAAPLLDAGVIEPETRPLKLPIDPALSNNRRGK